MVALSSPHLSFPSLLPFPVKENRVFWGALGVFLLKEFAKSLEEFLMFLEGVPRLPGVSKFPLAEACFILLYLPIN